MATFLRRAPDLFLAHLAARPVADPAPPDERVPFSTLAPDEERRFDEIYAPVAFATPRLYADGIMMPAWARRDWLARSGTRYAIREIVRTDGGWTYR
jgi:hypothetical protein